MGRKRKDGNPLKLEKRVYWHNGQFRYRHLDKRWEPLGTDVDKANERARLYNSPGDTYGTLGYWFDRYIADAEAGILPADRQKSARSIKDNKVEAEYLRAAFGKMWPQDLVREPKLIAEYRDRRGAKVRANREMSFLSVVYAWLMEKSLVPGLTTNPVKLIKRFREQPKERYVEDSEFWPVYSIAQRSIGMAMMLAYRTLQRPADVLRIAPQHVRTKSINGVEKEVLSVQQGKTGRTVDIEITPELDEALHMLSPDGVLGKLKLSESVTKIVPRIVHTTSGAPYTEDGVGAMLRRSCKTAGVKSFGLMDIRAKGATDMYLAGTPLEVIQVLMGHTSVQTTEIYIKRLLQTVQIAAPNRLRIGER